MSLTDQQRIETAADNCEVLRARLARYEDAEGKPIAQPTVVVLPDPKKEIVAWGHDMGGNYDEGHADGWNDALDEVARLNSSPARVGDDDDQAYDAEAERLTAEALGTGAGINPNATSIDDIFLSESAGGVGERAVPISSSLADYYRAAIAQSYPPIQAVIHELETVREWVISRKGQQEFLKNTGQKHTLIEKCEVVSELDHAINKARAALSAPSHGEQVQEVVPAGWKLVPVEPTPEMLAAGDKYIGTPATYKAMLSACPSPAITKDFSQFLSAVMDAAGLIRHGRQSKELSEYLGMKCMEYRGAAPSAGSQEQGE